MAAENLNFRSLRSDGQYDMFPLNPFFIDELYHNGYTITKRLACYYDSLLENEMKLIRGSTKWSEYQYFKKIKSPEVKREVILHPDVYNIKSRDMEEYTTNALMYHEHLVLSEEERNIYKKLAQLDEKGDYKIEINKYLVKRNGEETYRVLFLYTGYRAPLSAASNRIEVAAPEYSDIFPAYTKVFWPNPMVEWYSTVPEYIKDRLPSNYRFYYISDAFSYSLQGYIRHLYTTGRWNESTRQVLASRILQMYEKMNDKSVPRRKIVTPDITGMSISLNILDNRSNLGTDKETILDVKFDNPIYANFLYPGDPNPIQVDWSIIVKKLDQIAVEARQPTL